MKKLNIIFVMLECFLVMGFISCDSNGDSGSSGGSGTGVVGTWEGTETMTEAGITMTFKMTLILKADNTYTADAIMSVMGVDYPSVDHGTYSVSGNTITLLSHDGDVATGTISGNKITFSEDGETIVLTKK